MKKFKYFLWRDPNMGYGVGETLYYINAKSKEDAKKRMIGQGFKHDPHFIDGDIAEVKEFVQPKQIPVL